MYIGVFIFKMYYFEIQLLFFFPKAHNDQLIQEANKNFAKEVSFSWYMC